MNTRNKTKWNLFLLLGMSVILLFTLTIQSKQTTQSHQINKNKNVFKLGENIQEISNRVNERSNQIYKVEFKNN